MDESDAKKTFTIKSANTTPDLSGDTNNALTLNDVQSHSPVDVYGIDLTIATTKELGVLTHTVHVEIAVHNGITMLSDLHTPDNQQLLGTAGKTGQCQILYSLIAKNILDKPYVDITIVSTVWSVSDSSTDINIDNTGLLT
jgi:hypothetical protein